MREKFWLRVAKFAAKQAGDYQVRENPFPNVTFTFPDAWEFPDFAPPVLTYHPPDSTT